jgi:hypothetical protein
MFTMRPEAVAMANVLLKHHRLVCRRPRRTVPIIDSCLITYGKLCDQAGLPYLHHPGSFLGEIAQWCDDKGWPPINSLAVNAVSRMPGEGYDTAKGCSIIDWPKQAEACIKFRGYPDSVS